MLDTCTLSVEDRADDLNRRYGELSPAELIGTMAYHFFPERMALVSSFGADSVTMLSIVAEVKPDLPVLFLQTGKHFDETLRYRDEIAKRLGLTNIIDLYPEPLALAKEDPDGTLHARDQDACCAIRKVHPLARALRPYDAWITGRRRHQTFARRQMPVIEADGRHVKLNPIAAWSQEDVDAYIDARDLPRHPLVADGYPSIGCAPCTARVAAGEDARAGRWGDSGKTECGIHWMR
ncbi:phosphoadenylyl-sulfate reductase [Acuticoccus yangtzensis]|uniref:phosphoadenylyl-sulfate reductase n=1 Tax=Acuticoccus yangtzensis TaxID=1443441 RepID=UPI0009499945|nr:phosphoadenylyl-sulfate reductase [Acuticoccus yangtzensis]ORE96279.1 phosphoadenosine phosphosulfate reductase [Stappia sp. 22II-S9-Z10]